jgi:hypothetical protein
LFAHENGNGGDPIAIGSPFEQFQVGEHLVVGKEPRITISPLGSLRRTQSSLPQPQVVQ